MENNTLKKWGGFIVLLGISFSTLWTCAEPLGLETGFKLWCFIAFLAIVASIIFLLVNKYIEQKKIIGEKNASIENLNKQLEVALKAPKSTCCLIQQEGNICPLGVKSIYPAMHSTIRSTLESAKKSFKWYGLSAFNVVHNNRDIFSRKQEVKFHFTIVDPINEKLADITDEYHSDTRGRMSSFKLINESNALIQELKLNVNKNISVSYCNNIPTFRLIIIDDRLIYVSFYERGKDALNTFQIEIEDNNMNTNMFEWFYEFYEKSQLSIESKK